MQTGKMRHRGRPRRLRILLLAALIASSPGAGLARAQSAWEQGTAGTSRPIHRLAAPGDTAGGRLFFAAASIEEPYRIPGLVRSSAECAVRGATWQARLSWIRLAAPGYVEDAFECRAGRALAARRLHLHLLGHLERSVAEGFPSQGGARLGSVVALDPLPALTLKARVLSPPGGGFKVPGGRRRIPWRAHAGLYLSGLALLAEIDGTRHHGEYLRAGVILDATAGVSFLCGLRFDTGETSAGIMRRGRTPVVFAWRMHPVLGTSVAAGIGVMWP